MPTGQPEQTKTTVNLSSFGQRFNVYLYHYFNLIIIALLILIFILSYQFLLRPKYQSVANEEEINQKQADYLSKMNYLVELADLKKAFDQISLADREKINNIINNTNEQEDLFQEMQYLAKRENLTLDSVDVSPLDSGYDLENLAGNDKRSDLFDRVQVVKSSVKLSKVSYEGLINALRTIEVNLRIMDINKVNYDPINRTAVLEILSYQLKK